MAAPSSPPLPVLSEAQRNTLDLFNDWASPALAHLGVMKAVLEGHLLVDIGPLLKHFNLSGQPSGDEQDSPLAQAKGQTVLEQPDPLIA